MALRQTLWELVPRWKVERMILDEVDRRQQEMSEDDHGEEPCRPGGNYGLCRTHPTCEMVRVEIDNLRRELEE